MNKMFYNNNNNKDTYYNYIINNNIIIMFIIDIVIFKIPAKANLQFSTFLLIYVFNSRLVLRYMSALLFS